MRYYEPIWAELKAKKTARITEHVSLHPRTIKAVVKEKWMDLGYKLEIAPYHAFLSYKISGSVLTFHLTIKKSLNNITEHML
jgi:hypothetical protein